MWIGLEINLLSFIPFIVKKNDLLLSESIIKYFIVQAIGSILILISALLIINLEFITPPINSLILIMDLALLIKLGSAPLHFWFPEVIEGIKWSRCLVLLTWQKVAPFILIINNKINIKLILFFIISCLVVSALISFNQISLRKIIAFSSINNIGWILSSILCSFSIWLIYIIIYVILTTLALIIFRFCSLNFINQIMNINYKIKFIIIINIFSLRGLPPFIGFLPKWILIQSLSLLEINFLSLILILFTLIIIYVYIRIIFISITLSRIKIKIDFLKSNWLINFISFFFILSLITMTLIFNLI